MIVHIGRCEGQGKAVWARIKLRFDSRVAFHSLGQLAAADVSKALQGLDLGIATSPWSVAGKSGTIAAMLEHGVPVVVTRNDFQLREGPTPEPRPHPLLYRLDEQFLGRLRSGMLHKTAAAPRQDIFQSFVLGLKAASRDL